MNKIFIEVSKISIKKKILLKYKTTKGIFLGYIRTEKQFRIWDMATKAVVVVRDARMIHSVMPTRDEFKNLFSSWIKPHDGGFKL